FWIEKSVEWVGQVGEVRRLERITWHRAFRRIAEIVVLVAAIVDAEARADRGFTLECRGRPSQADAWSEVLVVRIVVRSAFRAVASAARNVDHRGPIQ